MSADTLEQIRYPIGKFELGKNNSDADLPGQIAAIEELPVRLRMLVNNLNDGELDTPYREGGWTVRQVVHHLADSHMNAFVRFKWSLTEDNPTIKPYRENLWAALDDTIKPPVQASLLILEGLHHRFGVLLRSMKPADFDRTFYHPENKRTFKLRDYVGLYAWHGIHHCEHINGLKKRNGWG